MNKFGAFQSKCDKDYLNHLTEAADSGVFKQNCKYHLALHPAQFNDFGQSVKDELDRKVSRYNEVFQGIMLGYENVKLLTQLGTIGLDDCYVHFDIMADFFIFRPELGMDLKGVVTKTTKDHVGCLVYSIFNISLPRPEEDENWLGQKAKIQSEVKFKIIFVELTARLPYIRGQILSISNGNMTNIEENGMDDIKLPIANTKKIKKRASNHDESLEESQVNGQDVAGKKVRKRRKISGVEDHAENCDQPPKKKKKTHSKELKNVEIKEEDVDGSKSVELEHHSAEDSNAINELIRETVRKKREEFEKADVNNTTTKHKKKKKHKQVVDEEEILDKKRKREEKKKKRENNSDVSLASPDLKSLFENNSGNLSEHYQIQIMANTKKIKKVSAKHDEDNTINKTNELIRENVRIKREELAEVTTETTKHKKKKKHKQDVDEFEILEKKEKRKEKKKQRENNTEVTLESFNLNALFENNSVEPSRQGQTQNMANNEDDMKLSIANTKKITRSPGKHDESLEESPVKRRKTNALEDYEENCNSPLKNTKKEVSKKLENVKIKQEVVDEDNTINERNELICETVRIKREQLEETEVSNKPRKQKKKLKQEVNDLEVPDQKEKYQEKKKKKENNSDVSLESLDLKPLFENNPVNLSRHRETQLMANNEDRGKKRRKSHSISQEVFLENIKLEPESDLEKLIGGKKRKRSKSMSH